MGPGRAGLKDVRTRTGARDMSDHIVPVYPHTLDISSSLAWAPLLFAAHYVRERNWRHSAEIENTFYSHLQTCYD